MSEGARGNFDLSTGEFFFGRFLAWKPDYGLGLIRFTVGVFAKNEFVGRNFDEGITHRIGCKTG